MKKHTVYVAGKRFVLLSDDKEDYIQKLVGEVNDTITKISLENPSLDRRAAAILCALDYADDQHKELMRNKSLSEKAQPLLTQADRQSKQLKELNEKLSKKDNDITMLKKELSQKDDKIKQLNKELTDLKVSFEKSTHLLDGKGMVKNIPAQNNQSRQEQGKNKGYKPLRQYSLFDNDKK